jgi:hypothetical protein
MPAMSLFKGAANKCIIGKLSYSITLRYRTTSMLFSGKGSSLPMYAICQSSPAELINVMEAGSFSCLPQSSSQAIT